MDRPVHSLARHAPRPLNFTSRPERAALPPAFNYTVTSSPTTTSSLSTPMSSEMGYKAPGEPMYSRESPPSAYFSRPTTPLLRSPLFPTGNSLRIGYPERPSMIPSMRLIPARISHNGDAVVHGIRQESQFPLTRTQSAPPNLEVASQTLPPLHPLPNPFEDSVSRTVTPSTLSSTSAWLPTGSPNLSLSFGSRDFPLPPSYNGTLWTQYTDNYLKSSSNRSQAPPSTPRSLMPGVHVEVKRSSPLVVVPRRPLSFGSIAASLHSTSLPSLPTPAARLPPHPRLQAHLELVSSQEAAAGSRNWVVAMDPIGTTPTSAKTFRSQLLPTDIPHWLASHGT
ncbi:hypothetical protein J3R30DRAFT_3695758 [Lentinula aciculospora]|uniref:Uncharacterized protein n=1 Tax=Lentinula aciculospora TaxID=153920 RepID=A0A9W9AQ74_9AGAR|nr:hypothetical protein J3R30DRAFT_3695758 [Lentinula aciculospora]